MLSNSGVKNGIFLGFIFIIFTHVCYMINPKWILNSVALLSYVIIIYFMWRSAAEERRKNEGLLSFGEAIKVIFITYIIGNLIGAIYQYLMFNIFDPSLNHLMNEVAMDSAKFFANLMGTEDQIDLMHDQLESQNLQMSFSMIFLNYLVALIFPGFVLSLVMAAITKRESA